MKILWLYWHDPKKNDSCGLSRRIHYGFVNKLNEFKAVEEINAKHLDKHRIAEFANILTTFLEHGRVEKRWGI